LVYLLGILYFGYPQFKMALLDKVAHFQTKTDGETVSSRQTEVDQDEELFITKMFLRLKGFSARQTLGATASYLDYSLSYFQRRTWFPSFNVLLQLLVVSFFCVAATMLSSDDRWTLPVVVFLIPVVQAICHTTMLGPFPERFSRIFTPLFGVVLICIFYWPIRGFFAELWRPRGVFLGCLVFALCAASSWPVLPGHRAFSRETAHAKLKRAIGRDVDALNRLLITPAIYNISGHRSRYDERAFTLDIYFGENVDFIRDFEYSGVSLVELIEERKIRYLYHAEKRHDPNFVRLGLLRRDFYGFFRSGGYSLEKERAVLFDQILTQIPNRLILDDDGDLVYHLFPHRSAVSFQELLAERVDGVVFPRYSTRIPGSGVQRIRIDPTDQAARFIVRSVRFIVGDSVIPVDVDAPGVFSAKGVEWVRRTRYGHLYEAKRGHPRPWIVIENVKSILGRTRHEPDVLIETEIAVSDGDEIRFLWDSGEGFFVDRESDSQRIGEPYTVDSRQPDEQHGQSRSTKHRNHEGG
jgi:hypothetical protein